MISLRTLAAWDSARLFDWENDPAVWAVSDTVRPYTRAEIEAFVARQTAAFADGLKQGLRREGQLRLIVEADERAVGAIDLFDYRPGSESAAIGVLIIPRERKKGYAAAALQRLEELSFGELGLKKLSARVHADNAASLRLFRRGGYGERIEENTFIFTKHA